MSKNFKQLINDFKEKMFESTETKEELKTKIKEENDSLIKNIIDYFMNKFDFLSKEKN